MQPVSATTANAAAPRSPPPTIIPSGGAAVAAALPAAPTTSVASAPTVEVRRYSLLPTGYPTPAPSGPPILPSAVPPIGATVTTPVAFLGPATVIPQSSAAFCVQSPTAVPMVLPTQPTTNATFVMAPTGAPTRTNLSASTGLIMPPWLAAGGLGSPLRPRFSTSQYGGDKTSSEVRPRTFAPRDCCTKALLVGINYRQQGPERELYGAINDIRSLAQFVEDQGWQRENILILDEDQPYDRQPTRVNILRMMEWLVDDCRPGDALFFAFSGHGTEVQGEEAGYLDQALVTVDQKLIDNIDLSEILVDRLPPRAQLTAVIDCCHGETVIDLPYEMRTGHRTRGPERPPLNGGMVICFSNACSEEEEGTGDPDAGYAGGACTNALLTALSVLGPDVTLGRLLKEMTRLICARGMGPIFPTISCSLPAQSRDPFSLTPHQDYLRPVPQRRFPSSLNPYIDFITLDQHALEKLSRCGR